MRPNRINLKLLRSAHRAESQNHSLASVASLKNDVSLSRRSVLKLGSVAAVATAPLLRSTGTMVLGPFEIQQSGTSFSVRYAGAQRWTVNVDHYAGKPRLDIQRHEGIISIVLRGARYAGTQLSADFQCEIRRQLSGFEMSLHSELFDSTAQCNFEHWLLSMAELRSSIRLDQKWDLIGEAGAIQLRGVGRWSYHADNSINVEGKDIVRTTRHALVSQGLRLIPGSEVSYLQSASQRHTRFCLIREQSRWNVPVGSAESRYWALSHDANVFDELIIDCSESRTASHRCAFVYSSFTTDASLALQPLGASDAASASSKHDLTIPLCQPRLAEYFDASTSSSSLIADFSHDGVWLHQDGLSLQLGKRENTESFEYHRHHDGTEKIVCQPSVLKVMPHMADVIASPVDILDDVAVCFRGNGANASLRSANERFEAIAGNGGGGGLADKGLMQSSDVVEVLKSNKRGYIVAKVGKNLINVKVDLELSSLSILRPRDLLVLTFYYDNFSIRKGNGSATLVPSDYSKEGVIVVEFPPQNIIEQAFYETDSSDKVKTGVKYDPVTKTEVSVPGDGNENLPHPPIKARMSGKSRLAFKVPKGTSLDLTLDALLRWENWTPSLVPVAQRQDTTASSGIRLYPGLVSYLSKQGMKFNAGAFMNELSGSTKSVSLESFEGALKTESSSAFRSGGLKFNSTYNSSNGVGAKTYVRKGSATSKPVSPSTFDLSFSYSSIAAKAGAFAALVKPKIRKPEDTETALELPYRLFLSPLNDSGWAHSRSEKSRNLQLKTTASDGSEKTENVDFTELWHTRLWFKSKKSDGSYVVNERDGNFLTGRKPKLRAVWSYDYTDDQTKPLSTTPTWSHTSLTSADRWALVVNSSDYYTKTTNPKTAKPMDYDPKAIDSDKLFLSSIGAWIDVHGAWDPVPSNIDLVDWIHRGTMGREHYVRVMYRGYLFPFGHKCTLVKITERKFGKPPQRGTYGAYMRQRMFVIVRQPDMILDDTNTLFAFQGREFPFKTVHIKTVVTPNIDDPNGSAKVPGSGPSGYGYPNEFYIRVASEDYLFHCTGTDWDGNTTDFVVPMAFVLGSISNTNPAEAEKIITYFNSLTDSSARKTITLDAARIAYGPSKTTGDTTLETNSMTLNAGFPGTLPKDVTWFYPKLFKANIRHQDVEQMSGSSVKPDVSFVQKFLDEGFDATKNAGEAFLQFASQVPMSFGGSSGGSSDKSGGFISPNQALSGLSRAIGPISGAAGNISGAIDKFADSSFNFDPKDFLGALDAKIFGVISLFDIIQMITGTDPRTTLLPQLLSKVLPNLGTDPTALLNQLQNEVYNKLKDSYDKALADATATASTVTAKLQEMKDLLDGLKSQLDALSTAISSASGTGDIFTALTTTLPEFLNWITTNIGPLGIIPQEALTTIQDVAKVLQNLQNGIRIGFDWKPRMQADEFGFFVPQDPDDTFVLSAYALLPLSNKDHSLSVGDPEAKVEGYLQNFSINLIPTVMDIVALPIVKLGFSAELGKKSDIFCNIGAMQWKGPLSFVNELQKFIPMDGFVDPPGIDVDTSGITISFDLAIPTISVGVFAITNISLGAALQLPFLGDSMLFKFDFCKKDSPFHVTYMMLGGGGYFGMTLSLNGIEKIEAAIEIGAELALDFGVASGSVSIFAGIYFSIEGDVVTLQGYVKIHGEVDVLGLISASLTLEMTITYISTGKLYGTATLTIEIHLFIFSGSVDITVEKYFKGSAGDPTIAQMIPDALYPDSTKKYFELYVGAFA